MNNPQSNSAGMAFVAGLTLGGLAVLLMPDRYEHQVKDTAKSLTGSLKNFMQSDDKAQRIEDIFNENTAKARAIYQEAQTSLANTLEDLGTSLKNIDQDKYQELVADTVAYIQEHHQLPKAKAKKLQQYLVNDFDKLESRVS